MDKTSHVTLISLSLYMIRSDHESRTIDNNIAGNITIGTRDE